MITANRPYSNHRCGYHGPLPDNVTTATNQALLRPTLKTGKGKDHSGSIKNGGSSSAAPLLHRVPSTSSSGSTISNRSGIVNLVVEDKPAEETERVRARKEGGAAFNQVDPKRYVRQYPPEAAGEEVREGFDHEPAKVDVPHSPLDPARESPKPTFTVAGDDDDEEDEDEEEENHRKIPDYTDGGSNTSEDSPWSRPDDHNHEERGGSSSRNDYSGMYGSMNERDVWGS